VEENKVDEIKSDGEIPASDNELSGEQDARSAVLSESERMETEEGKEIVQSVQADSAEDSTENQGAAGEETQVEENKVEEKLESKEAQEEVGTEDVVVEVEKSIEAASEAGAKKVVLDESSEEAGTDVEKKGVDESTVSKEDAVKEVEKDEVHDERATLTEGEEKNLASSEGLPDKTGEVALDEELASEQKELLNQPHKRFQKKWIISGTIVVVSLVVTIGFFIAPHLPFPNTKEKKTIEQIAGPVFDMKFFLPLAESPGKTRFVKVTVIIELLNSDFKREIDEKRLELRKEIIELVLSKSPGEMKSSQGKEALREEITTRLNKCLSNNSVKNTYFAELIVL
jgi:flagellar basal body-associated protein FliL